MPSGIKVVSSVAVKTILSKPVPLSQPDNKAQKGHYMDHRNANHTDSTTDKVLEPLTRLLTDLVAQIKLLTPSGHGFHAGTPTYDGKGRNMVSSRWVSTMVTEGIAMTTTIKGRNPTQDCHIDHHHKGPFCHNGHKQG